MNRRRLLTIVAGYCIAVVVAIPWAWAFGVTVGEPSGWFAVWSLHLAVGFGLLGVATEDDRP